MLNPETQLKAQEELDRVIGRDRLPDFSDVDSLPYLNAVYKEVLRWFPNIPLGVPHSAHKDDEYRGFRIPKGTIVYPNVWSVSFVECWSSTKYGIGQWLGIKTSTGLMRMTLDQSGSWRPSEGIHPFSSLALVVGKRIRVR